MLSLKLITPPVLDPWLVTDPVVKQHLRIIDTAEDALLTLLIGKTREMAEQICRRALITQQWLMVLDKFPQPGLETSSANWYGPSWGTGPGPLTTIRPDGQTLYEIYIPLPPLQTVDSIWYWDATTATKVLLSPAAYIVDNISEPARVVPAPGVAWPSVLNRINAVEITFTAGYGLTGASVPSGILNWMLMMIGTIYENRELVAILNRGKVQDLPLFDGLLDAYRVIKY